MRAGAEVVEDYRATSLTLREHPVHFLRETLARDRYRPLAGIARVRDRRPFQGAGIILVRQKPGSAKGVMFVTLEDETGHANLVIWPQLFEAERRLILAASMLGVDGVVQREGEVIHLVARRLFDLSALLATVGERELRLPAGRGDEARHGGGAPDARDHAPRLAFMSLGVGHPRAIRVARTEVRR
jgi:DNA polymerase III alpha subunit